MVDFNGQPNTIHTHIVRISPYTLHDAILPIYYDDDNDVDEIQSRFCCNWILNHYRLSASWLNKYYLNSNIIQQQYPRKLISNFQVSSQPNRESIEYVGNVQRPVYMRCDDNRQRHILSTSRKLYVFHRRILHSSRQTTSYKYTYWYSNEREMKIYDFFVGFKELLSVLKWEDKNSFEKIKKKKKKAKKRQKTVWP